jgi:dihydroxyacetone kinase DhaKLM complex PTS-EIIA-like component DhaM
MAIEMCSPEQQAHIRLSSAPLVEGAIMATIEASLGHSLEDVNAAAEAARNMEKIVI